MFPCPRERFVALKLLTKDVFRIAFVYIYIFSSLVLTNEKCDMQNGLLGVKFLYTQFLLLSSFGVLVIVMFMACVYVMLYLLVKGLYWPYIALWYITYENKVMNGTFNIFLKVVSKKKVIPYEKRRYS